MRLKPFLCCTSLLVLLALPAAAEPLAPRGEVSVKGGTDRSLLTTEFWAPLAQQSDRVLYGDVRLMGDNDENREGNLGLGYRQIKNDAVIGVHGWIDRRRTQHNSTFHQLTFGVEHLGHIIDARANVYIPINNARNIITRNIGVTSPYLAGSGIYYDTNGSISETPQYGIDGELGYRIPALQRQIDAIRIYGGGYYFFRDNTVEVPGVRFRTEAQINKIVSIGARVQYDKPRGTQGFLEATLKFPFSAKRLYQESGIRSRLDESPERDVDIVTESKVTDTGLKKPVLNTTSGTQQRILYVDNSKGDSGDGSYEKPFNTLKSAEAMLQANDILYVNSGDGTTRNMDKGIVIDKPNIQMIGSGSALTYGGVTLLNGGTAPKITNTETRVQDFTNNIFKGNGVFIKADNTTVSGITVNSATGEGIFVLAQLGQHFHSVKIDNISASGNRNGVYLIGVDPTTQVDNFVLTNSITNNNSFNGFYTLLNNGAKITNMHLKNTILNTNGSTGVSIQGLNNNKISNIYMENIEAKANTHGLAVVTSTSQNIIENMQVRNSTFSNNLNYGAFIQSTSNATIRDTYFTDVTMNNNAFSGLYIYANGGIINNFDVSNTIASFNSQNGIYLNSGGTGTINGARLSGVIANNNVQNGLYILGANAATSIVDNAKVANSSFMNNSINGIYLLKSNAGATFNIDLGGGAFGSIGQNRSSGNTGKDLRLNYTGGGAVFAKNNWWGDVTGLQAGRMTLSASTTVDSTAFLTTDPRP